MAFSLTGLGSPKIPENGGHELRISGVFEAAHRYQVFIGDTESSADHPCYSGKPGQPNFVYPWKDDTLRVFTPRLPPGMTLTVFVKDLDTLEGHKLEDSIEVQYEQFQTTVFGLKQVMPVFYRTGPRDIELVPEI